MVFIIKYKIQTTLELQPFRVLMRKEDGTFWSILKKALKKGDNKPINPSAIAHLCP